MNKVIKWFGIIAGALVLLVILAMVLIPLFVDVQKYKPLIEKEVSQATGRTFTLGGDLHLSVFPWIGVSLSDLHLGNPAGFSQKDLLTVASLDVKVKLWPLLSKDIQVKQFVVKGAHVVLETRKDGRTGWQDIGSQGKPAAEAPAPEKSQPVKPATGQLPISNLMVGEFSIVDSSLLWLDEASGTRRLVSDIQLKLTDVSLDRPILLDFSAKLDQYPLSLKGSIGPVGKDPGKGTLALALTASALKELRVEINGEVHHAAENPQFGFNLNLPEFSPRKLLASLNQPLHTSDPNVLSRVAFKVRIAGDTKKVQISDGVINLDDSLLNLSAEASDLSKPNLSLDLKLDAIDLKRYLPPSAEPQAPKSEQEQPTPPGMQLSDLNLKLTDVSQDRPILLDVAAKLNQQPLALKGSLGPVGKDPGKGTLPLTLSLSALKQLRVEISGEVRHPADNPQYFIDFDLPEFSPRKLLAALNQPLPLQTADPKVLSRVAFKVRIAGDTQKVLISDGVLDLDDSVLNLSARAGEFSKPNLAFDVKLDAIDLDRYLPPAAEPQAEKGKQEPPPAAAAAKKTDYGPLRRMVLDGRLQIGKLKVKNAKVAHLNLKVTADKGVIRVDPLSLELYKGKLAAQGLVNVQQDAPQTHLGLQVNGVQAGPLMVDLLKKDVIEGTLKADLALDLAGDAPDQIKKTLNGKGNLQFKDGAIKGIDLAGMVRNAVASFGLAEKPKVRPRTDFAELVVPFSIKNGLVNIPQTTLASPLLRLKASGDADLNTETLNFRVEPLFVATLVGQGDTRQRTGIMVPVLVSGTFDEPKYRPDLKSMIQQHIDVGKEVETLKKGIQEKLPGKEQTQQLEEKKKELEKGARELLKGLPFGK